MRQILSTSFVLIVLASLFCAYAGAQVLSSSHVWIVAEENHSYENATASMPYFMSLANSYGLATQYYADMHNSLSALMHLTAGQTVTTDDNTTLTFNVDNIVRQLLLKGKTFRSYQESLPYAGFSGLYAYPYVKRHNPLMYFIDVASSGLKYDSVPYTQLASDLQNGKTGNFNYVTPNMLDDAHDGTMAAADSWLAQQLPAILAQPAFQAGGDGLLFIVFDEGNIGSNPDDRCSATVSTGCGGRVATVVIGPNVRRGFQSTQWYNHESLLKTVCLALGTASCPGAASSSAPMADFFGTNPPSVGVTLVAPVNNATVGSPVHFVAFATAPTGRTITAMRIYVDNVGQYTTYASSLDTYLPLPTGKHYVVGQAWDNTGAVYKTPAWITVQ